jgi:hypothetical protein
MYVDRAVESARGYMRRKGILAAPAGRVGATLIAIGRRARLFPLKRGQVLLTPPLHLSTEPFQLIYNGIAGKH